MEISAYVAGACQRFTEFGGFHPVEEERIPTVVGWWAEGVLERHEPGLITQVVLVPAREDRPATILRDQLLAGAVGQARQQGIEATVLLLMVARGPISHAQFEEWVGLRRQEGAARVVVWIVDLARGRLFQHDGPPFGVDPNLAVLAAPVPVSGEIPAPETGGRREYATGPGTPRRPAGPSADRWQAIRETWATSLLLAAIGAVFGAMAVSGGGLEATQSTSVLQSWGAVARPDLWTDRQFWRLFTAIFLHIGTLHLLLNGVSLWSVGRVVEILFGPGRMLYIFLVAGVTGSVLSAVLGPPVIIGAGASGAIFGLLGAVIWFRLSSPMGSRIAWRPLVITLGLNLGLGLALYQIVDNWNHVGGLAGGLVAAAVVGVPVAKGAQQPRFSLPLPARFVSAAVVTVVLAGVLVGRVPLPGPGRDLADSLAAADRGDYPRAEAGLRKAIRQEPDEPALRAMLVQVYIDHRKCKEARQLYQELSGTDPDYEGLADLKKRLQICGP